MPDDSIEFFSPFKQFYILSIPAPIAAYRGLSPGAKLVYGRLQRYAGRKGVAFPHIPELAEEVGLGERQTKDYLAELVKEKFIHRERVFARGNVYKFIKHPCLFGQEIGTPRVNTGAFGESASIGRDTARQSIGRDTAPAIGRDTARQEGVVSLLLEEGHIEESHNSPKSPDFLNPKPQHTPSSEDLPEPDPILDPEESGVRTKGSFKNRMGRKDPEKAQRKAERTAYYEKQDAIRKEMPRTEPRSPVAASPDPSPTQISFRPTAVEYAARWNELVTASPVVWDASDKISALAVVSPRIDAGFDRICQKAQTIHLCGTDAPWLTFRWLFRTKEGKFNWERLLTDEYDWMMKPRTNGQQPKKDVVAELQEKRRKADEMEKTK